MRKNWLSRNKIEDTPPSLYDRLEASDYSDGFFDSIICTVLLSSKIIQVSLHELKTIYTLDDVMLFWEVIHQEQELKYI